MGDRVSAPNDGDDSSRTFEYAYDEETPASVAVVEAVCAVEDVDPVNAPQELDFTLFDHVNPEALDAMVGDGTGDGDVIVDVTIADYRVLISDTGRIRVRPRE